MTIRDRIRGLRASMKKHKVQAYYVPSTDPHQSEYVPEWWQRRAWISGFTGSAGDVVVTAKEAALWTDGRYFLQAEEELRGTGVRLMRMGDDGVPTVAEYLAGKLKKGQAVGFDPRVVSLRGAEAMADEIEAKGAVMRPLEKNLVDEVWGDRPAPSTEPIQVLAKQFAGETSATKLKRVRVEMKQRGADAHILTALDAIAWLFNIRGRDVDFNPVAVCYALITPKDATLFIDGKKVPPAARKRLGTVKLQPYDAVAAALRKLGKKKARVWVDAGVASQWVAGCLKGARIVGDPTPVARMKARKNRVEIEGMRAAHVRDGAAVARFLHWLETAVRKEKVTEISAASKLEEFRREGDHFQGLSFRTISGYADHGAIIHYTVTPDSDVRMKPRGIYLVDSGAQYLDGTTDITRTVLMGGKATKEQKDRFTRVLRGHIALARAVFPEGTRGMRLDTLARVPLWEAGLDYNHGTGHGVGAYLNVHEGPQSISPNKDLSGVPLEPGNILSNEPGYYREGAYGIRIENVVLVVEDESASNGRPFHRFDTLTLCPIDRRLIDSRMLTRPEVQWVDAYHRRVRKTLSPLVPAATRTWLKQATAPLTK